MRRHGRAEQAHVLERNEEDVYVHYVNTDKRLDEWVAARDVRPAAGGLEAATVSNGAGRKRKRGSLAGEGSRGNGSPSKSDAGAVSVKPEEHDGAAAITEEEYDIEHHQQITAKRNFDKVVFGRWQIKTWCVSYPLRTARCAPFGDAETGTGTSRPTLCPRLRRTTAARRACTHRTLLQRSRAFRVPRSARTGALPTFSQGGWGAATGTQASTLRCGSATGASSTWQRAYLGNCTSCVRIT